ncbi:hypothetical protein GUJ93_ZPchr0010g9948 [Zizania palustris]|uniref:14-3-3 domain-containing protein n=1 Tax=Zizania palustris TaxID=103762 RepID=A0A8J5WD52_ZIZPA|nr:hypothetical protein GUJ93_ZPchr0010g9948 [Zizania palustris]
MAAAAAGGGAREEMVYMAKLAEQAERYEEMVEFMEKVVTAVGAGGGELTVEERNLLSVAYKNVIGARRASWRIVSSIEQKEEGRGAAGHAAAARGYRGRVEAELSNICAGILRLLDERLVPAAAAVDSKVFYLKMKGDYHRYLAEFKTGAERKDAADATLTAYQAAQVSYSPDQHLPLLLLTSAERFDLQKGLDLGVSFLLGHRREGAVADAPHQAGPCAQLLRVLL